MEMEREQNLLTENNISKVYFFSILCEQAFKNNLQLFQLIIKNGGAKIPQNLFLFYIIFWQ